MDDLLGDPSSACQNEDLFCPRLFLLWFSFPSFFSGLPFFHICPCVHLLLYQKLFWTHSSLLLTATSLSCFPSFYFFLLASFPLFSFPRLSIWFFPSSLPLSFLYVLFSSSLPPSNLCLGNCVVGFRCVCYISL